MPKMRTNRSAAKRFRKTGGSRHRRQKAYRSHILTKKRRKRKRRLRKPALVSAADQRRVKRMLAGNG
ncbi:MAG: 50S ribosomal protein L35 [Gemmatimonadota bacterium]